jgi:hypothetical protein
MMVAEIHDLPFDGFSRAQFQLATSAASSL